MRNIAAELRDIVFNSNDNALYEEQLNKFDKYFLENIYPELKALAQRGITSFDFEYTFPDFSVGVCLHVFEAYGFKSEFYNNHHDDEDRFYLSWEPYF